MFGGLFSDFLAWVSLQPHDWLDVRTALGTHRYYSPVQELHLFDRWHADKAMQMLDLDRPLTVALSQAKRPVHEGFIAALELVPIDDRAPSEGKGDIRPSVMDFVARESRRPVESWLKSCYRDEPELERDIRFRGMDFPAFDNGSVSCGFGLMIERDGFRRWLWSRAQFHHK